MSGLVVLLGEPPSSLVRKGELIPRYYNPGNLFDRVHFIIVAPETADPAELVPPLRAASGDADVSVDVIELPETGLFTSTLGLRPRLLERHLSDAVTRIEELGPALVRAYANGIHALAGTMARERLKIPFVVSLHINPDVDLRDRARFRDDWREALVWRALQAVERRVLRSADATIVVYRPILPYARRLGARRIELIYNSVYGEALSPKEAYRLHQPPRLVSVGRQFAHKNPENLIRGLATVRDQRASPVELVLIGNGPLHEPLVETASGTGVEDLVRFETDLPNRQVCRLMSEADLYVAHTEYFEVGKPVLEASLIGLPIVLSRRHGSPVPEFESGWLRLVNDTPDAWAEAILELLDNGSERESLGHRARAFAREHWEPAEMEERVVSLYRELRADEASAGVDPRG